MIRPQEHARPDINAIDAKEGRPGAVRARLAGDNDILAYSTNVVRTGERFRPILPAGIGVQREPLPADIVHVNGWGPWR